MIYSSIHISNNFLYQQTKRMVWRDSLVLIRYLNALVKKNCNNIRPNTERTIPSH